MKPIICDFGVSKLKDGTMVTNVGGSNAGTLAYQHKEQLKGEKPTMAVNVYSFGVIMGEVYSRKKAWDGMSGREVINAIERDEYPTFQGISTGAQEVLCLCFQPASNRPSFQNLLPKLELLNEVDIW